jgi:DeoR/GlpR family transcriptional regulator of sugar metabolism
MKAMLKRRKKIIDLLKEEKILKVSDISQLLKVSDVTIRRDFDYLEQEGMVKKIPGGAVLTGQSAKENSLQEKENYCKYEKMLIARKCAEMVKDNDIVMLSAGSTTTYLARELKEKKNLTIVTTGINIGHELSGLSNIHLVIAGGTVRSMSFAMVGHIAENTLKSVKADIAFIGVDGIELNAGYTTPDLSEAHTDVVMMQSAKRSIVVADHTKFGKTAFSVVAPLEQVDEIVTDAGVDEYYVQAIRNRGVKVSIASEYAEH